MPDLEPGAMSVEAAMLTVLLACVLIAVGSALYIAGPGLRKTKKG